MSNPVVQCPVCGAPVKWNEHAIWRPFCSERCRLIDLGEWIEEKRRIPGDEVPPHADGDDDQSP